MDFAGRLTWWISRRLSEPCTSRPTESRRDRPGPAGFDEAFALQLTRAYRTGGCGLASGSAAATSADGLLDAFDERLPFILTKGQIGGHWMRSWPTLVGLVPCATAAGRGWVGRGAGGVARDVGGGRCRRSGRTAGANRSVGGYFRRSPGCSASWPGGTLDAPEQATGVVLITGSSSAGRRRQATHRPATGEAGIIIGTHALLEDDVAIPRLGLAVVDEQHRFGVLQREAAAEGHQSPFAGDDRDVPRRCSRPASVTSRPPTLREIPAGRADVTTVVVDTVHPAVLDSAARAS